MSRSWLRQLLKKRFVGQGATSPVRRGLRVELLEDRTVPATIFWTGGAVADVDRNGDGDTVDIGETGSLLWSNPFNWSGLSVPGANDDVVFNNFTPPESANYNAYFADTDNRNAGLTGTVPHSIMDLTTTIKSLTIRGPGPTTGGNVGWFISRGRVVQDPIRDPDFPLGIFIPAAPGRLTILGNFDFDGPGVATTNFDTRFVSTLQNINVTTFGARLYINGSIGIGGGVATPVGILKLGPGTAVLGGANTFDGLVQVDAGILAATNDNALGGSSVGTVVANGATLTVTSNVPESVSIQGNGMTDTGTPTGTALGALNGNGFVGGGVVLNSSAAISGTYISPSSGAIVNSILDIDGVISGAGNLTTLGTVALNNANTYNGATFVRDDPYIPNTGGVIVRNDDALSPGSFTEVASGASLVLSNSGATGLRLIDDEVLYLNGLGNFNTTLQNFTGALTSTGTIATRTTPAEWRSRIFLATNASIGTVELSTLLVSGRVSDLPIPTATLGTLSPVELDAVQAYNALNRTTTARASLTKLGKGTTIYPNANPDFAGNVVVTNGTLVMRNATALGPATGGSGGSIVVNSDISTLQFGTLEVQGQYTAQKNLTLNGNGYASVGALLISDDPADGGATAVTWTAPVTLTTAALTNNLSATISTDAGQALTITGVVGGGTGRNLQKNGAGSVTLTAANTFLGSVTVRAGTLAITSNTALGAVGGAGTTISSGATLSLASGLTVVNEALTLSSELGVAATFLVSGGTNLWTGVVNLVGNSTGVGVDEIIINTAAGSVEFSNVVSGDSKLRKLGAGTMRFSGSASNTFKPTQLNAPVLSIEAGTTVFAKTLGPNGATVNAVAGAIVIGDGAGGDSVDVLRLEQPNQIPDTVAVSILSSGLLDLNGVNETIAGPVLTGGEIRTGAGTLTLGGNVTALASADASKISGKVSLGGVTRTFSAQSSGNTEFFSSAATSQFGSAVTFTVNIDSGGGPTAGGTVSFFDGATLLGTVGGSVSGGITTFTFTTTNLPAGSHTITAVYSGDGNYATQTIALPSTQEVVGAPSRQLLTSNANQTSPGNAAFTLTVTRSQASNPIPTGTVTIKANGVAIPGAVGTLDATGAVTVSAFALTTPGSYVITADYSGDAYYGASTVTLLSNQIIVDAPSLSLTSSANSSPVGLGVAFSFAATNQGTSPVPTGTVSFFDGATIIGTVKTLDLNGRAVSDVITTLTAATHVITAVYSGDTLYQPQTILLRGGQIVVNNPAVLLSSDVNPASVGQTITFTLRVNSGTATGTVIFKDNGTPISGFVNVIGGVATFTTQALTAGTHAITADYSGGNGSPGANGIILLPAQVVATPLQVQASSRVDPSATGQIVTFDFVAIRQTGDPVPTGTVQFFDGATLIGSATLTTAGLTSSASVITAALTFGPHFITAVYSGDGNYAGTTVQLQPQQAVTTAPTVRVASSANTSLVGQNVTFTFTTAPQGGAPTPTGTVTFFDGSVQIGLTQTLVGGTASVSTAALTLGSHTITAVYSGNSFYEPQTATVAPTQTVVATLPTPVKTTVPAQEGVIEVNAVISGAAGTGIIKTGGGRMRIGGANTYSGTTQVSGGTLQLIGNNTLPDGTVVTLAPGTTLDVNGQTDAIASLTGGATTTLAIGAGALIIGGDNSSSTFSGAITGTAAGGLAKVGTGTLTLDGPTSLGYAGTTIIIGGTVFVNTDLRNAPVEVRPGATLGGTGTVGSVTVTSGATLSPGLSPALLSINGDLTFYSSTFIVEANGTTLGSGYDSVAVSGIATLNNSATLVFSPTFSPNVGATFTILTATGGVTGTFSGLADLATFTIGTRTYQIDYTANSVLVRVLALASTATIQSNTNPSLPGQSVTFTVTITPAAPGDAVPTGNVQFYDNGVAIGGPIPLAPTGTLNQAAASFATPALTNGSHVITADFTPTPSTYEARAQTDLRLVQSVTVASTVTLQALNGPSVFGDTVGFAARVAQQTGLAVPTGTITFINSTTGEVLGVVALDANGAASLSTSTIRAGTSIISAVYSGDAFYRSGSGTASQIVDRQARLVVGTDAGPVATVQVFDPRTGALLRVLTPFDGYTLGVKVATGDVNNDGISDIIVSAGAGAPGGHVKVYSGSDYLELASFFTFIGYTGGVNVAAGDVNGDGFADIVVGTAIANDHVKAFSGRNPADTLLSFFAYSTGGGNPVGVTVGAGDVNGDGLADVITGSATFAGHVKAFSGQNNGQLLGSYFAYGAGYLGGIYVAAGDLNGDGRAEIITGATNAPHVKALDALTGAELQSFIAYPGATFGVRVGAIDRDGDGLADILTGAGGSAPHVKVFDGQTLDLLDSFLAVPVNMPPSPGIFVGGSTK